MFVKKKYLLFLFLCLLLISLLAIISLKLLAKPDLLKCNSTINKDKQCGQVSIGGKSSYFINGIIESKVKDNDEDIIYFKTLNNYRKIVKIKLTLPPSSVPFGYAETVTDSNNKKIKRTPKITADEFYDKIYPNDEVKISFYVASSKEIQEIKPKFDKSTYRYLDCNSSNKILLNTIIKTSVLTSVVNNFYKITNNCPTYIAGWEKI